MSQVSNHSNTNQECKQAIDTSISLLTCKCHKCSSLISIDTSQIKQTNNSNINKKNNNNNNNNNQNATLVSMQCVYVQCEIRSNDLFECINCSELALCRNCKMPLCKLCRLNLKVLTCSYCNSFICSQQCYASLLKKYFQFLEDRYAISVHAHQSMHFLRKLLLPPHLHSNLANISDDNLPFHVCEKCKAQNCGCIDWLSCVNCRKYYCVDCEDNALQKCVLEDCQSYTCCHKEEWNAKCDYCNKFDNCGLIFCTKGHCNTHIIINREIGYDEINNPPSTQASDEKKINEQNDENDNDVDLTIQ